MSLQQFFLNSKKVFFNSKNLFAQSVTRLKYSNKAQLNRASPARACLYVPGNDSKKVSKIFSSNADCIVLDCEDGVALNKKTEARQNIRKLFDTDERVQNDLEGKYAVRMNSPSSSDLALEDIKAFFSLNQEKINSNPNAALNLLPKTIFVPKTNTTGEIKWLLDKFEGCFKNYKQFPTLNMFFYMESAIGLMNLNDIIKTTLAFSAENYKNRYNLVGFVFGSDDFCADIGASRTKDSLELVYARQKLITICKAYKLKVIDMVYIDYKDLEGLRLQAEQGARMGFTGKQVIHPGQVDITQEAFTPSKEKIEWALGLIEAFKQNQSSGAGAFNYRGQMIDMPLLLQAQNIISIVEKTKKI